MNQDILGKATDALRKEGLDAFVVCSPENFAYLAGFTVPSHHVLRWRHSIIVITADGATRVLTVDMEESTVRKNIPDEQVHVWGEFSQDPMAVLADILGELGLASARVGIELDYLPARDFHSLSAKAPKASFIDSSAMFSRMRYVKTPREIELLRRLSRMADKGIADAYAAVSAGSTEMDIAAALTRSIYEQGAQDFKFMIVATGERSQLPNVGPTLRKLEHGDVCRVEIFPIINGYHAGVCRSACVGEPPAKAAETWSILSNATRELVELIRPGLPTSAVHGEYMKMIASLNMPPIEFAGHGIGLHLHEEPYFAAGDESSVESGMVFGIEPLIYRTGYGFGLQNKDMILVTDTGCELLSDVTDTTDLIRVG